MHPDRYHCDLGAACWPLRRIEEEKPREGGESRNPENRPRFAEGSQFFTEQAAAGLFYPNRVRAAIGNAGRRSDDPVLIELAQHDAAGGADAIHTVDATNYHLPANR